MGLEGGLGVEDIALGGEHGLVDGKAGYLTSVTRQLNLFLT